MGLEPRSQVGAGMALGWSWSQDHKLALEWRSLALGGSELNGAEMALEWCWMELSRAKFTSVGAGMALVGAGANFTFDGTSWG